MLFNVFDWQLLIISFLASYSTMLIQTLAFNAVSEDWLNWYEDKGAGMFEKTRCMNQVLEALLIFASSIGFFFLLHDPSGSQATAGTFWNYAVAMYVVFTALDGLWLVPFWHYKSRRGATVALYCAMGAAYLYTVIALVGTTFPVACALPVLPRALWLTYHAAVETVMRNKPRVSFASGTKDEEPHVPHADVEAPVDKSRSSEYIPPKQNYSMNSAPAAQPQYYPASQTHYMGSQQQSAYSRSNVYMNPMSTCPIAGAPPAATGWRQREGKIYFFDGTRCLGQADYVTLD